MNILHCCSVYANLQSEGDPGRTQLKWLLLRCGFGGEVSEVQDDGALVSHQQTSVGASQV